MMSLPLAPVSNACPHTAYGRTCPPLEKGLRNQRRSTLEDPGAIDQLQRSLRQASQDSRPAAVLKQPSTLPDSRDQPSAPIAIARRPSTHQNSDYRDHFAMSPASVRSVAMERRPSSPWYQENASPSPSSWQPAKFSDTSSLFMPADNIAGSPLGRRLSIEPRGRPAESMAQHLASGYSRAQSSDRAQDMVAWLHNVRPGSYLSPRTGPQSRGECLSRTVSPIFGAGINYEEHLDARRKSTEDQGPYGEVHGGEEVFAFYDDISPEPEAPITPEPSAE